MAHARHMWHSLVALVLVAVPAVAACGTRPTVDVAYVPAALVGTIHALHMFDATTGWAATSSRLLRTTDGAIHWRDVTPPTPKGASEQGIVAFSLSADVTWVARSVTTTEPGGPQPTVFHTMDGGQTWRAVTVPAYTVAQIMFADQEHGWMLANLDTADGEQGADILRTTDGGTTWARVASANDRPGALPLRGRKTGLTFRDARVGWATLGGAEVLPSPALRTPMIWRTQDGGVTWHETSLALPPVVAQYPWNYVAGALPPTFFGARQGVLPVIVGSQVAGGAVGTLVYTTEDGGDTWSASTPVPTVPDATCWLDLSHGWIAADVDANGALFSTTDGGAHWTSLTPGRPFMRVSVLSFVSPKLGWAIGGAGLLRTTDGGRTWTILAAAPPSGSA